MSGYCLGCRAHREMQEAEEVTLKNGRAATRGRCGNGNIADHNFYRARAKKGNPPILGGVVLDQTGTPLVWDPLKGVAIEYVSG